MSYDAILIAPVVGVSVLLALVAIVNAKTRSVQPERGMDWRAGSMAIVPLLVAQWVAWHGLRFKVHGFRTYGPGLPPLAGWTLQHVEALELWKASDIAKSYLPWVGVPLVMALATLYAARVRVPYGRWLLALGCTLSMALTLQWVRPHLTRTWAPADARWSMGYVTEWISSGSNVREGGGPCQRFFELKNRSNDLGDAAKTALSRLGSSGASKACRKVCADQASRGSFNPGVLEGHCRTSTP